MMWLKRKLREWIIEWSVRSDEWVIPRQLVVDIDKERYDMALEQINEIEKLWPNDPKIIYYRTLISFLRGDE